MFRPQRRCLKSTVRTVPITVRAGISACRTTQNYLPLLSPSCLFLQFGSLAARTPAHPAERRVEQEWPGPHRLRAGKGACTAASWALHIGLVFFVAHENRRPRAANNLRESRPNSTAKRKGTRHKTGPLPPSRVERLTLGDHRRRGLALTNLRAAGDAQEREPRGHCYSELLWRCLI
jgi:hypothetical protein